MSPPLEYLDLHTLPRDVARAGFALMSATWPHPDDSPEDDADALAAEQRAGAFTDGRSTWHVVRAPRADPATPLTLLALAVVKARPITVDGNPLVIGALASVCVDLRARQQGLGSQVVTAAFARVTEGAFPWLYFQTSRRRRAFYERLGAVLATNPVVNSLATDPKANPFWDEITMRYPAGDVWPAGTIDLLGPGY